MPLADGRQVVATAGTRVPLVAASTAGGWLTLAAEADNTGAVVVGGSTVVADLATRRGVPLFTLPGASLITFYVDDLSTVFIDAERDGDGVTFLVS